MGIKSKRSVFGKKMKNLKESFKAMDTDNSGQLSSKELGMAFKRLGMFLDPKSCDDLVAALDEDGSGEIDYEEFEEALIEELKRQKQKKLTTIDLFSASA